MGTEVLKSYGSLQLELEQARSSLKGYDESIKRLIGRDPSESSRPGKRLGPPAEEPRNRQRGGVEFGRRNRHNHESNEPQPKRRTIDSSVSVFKRLSERPQHVEEEPPIVTGKQLISRVIATPKEVPSRQEALAAQGTDEKSKARNRRMFGALLGTLQKFQQEETKLKQKEEKRAQVEKKLEEQEIREKEELKRERQDLFFNRKRKQAEIRMIEMKMNRMKELQEWEGRQRPRMNFIQTKVKPHIYFVPKIHNEKSLELLEACRNEMEKSIDRKRQEVYDELDTIESRMKKNFSRGDGQEVKQEEDEFEDEDNLEEIRDENETMEDTQMSASDVLQLETDVKNSEEMPQDVNVTVELSKVGERKVDIELSDVKDNADFEYDGGNKTIDSS